MMMIRAEDIRRHGFTAEERLFLDTNVWLSVYGPIAFSYRKRSRVYSAAIRDIFRAGSSIFINVLVLSEFVNSFARLEFKQCSEQFPTFKHFRESGLFAPIAKDISLAAMNILNKCNKCGSGFETMDSGILLGRYADGNSDLCDELIAETCRSQNLTLVTDDGDFAEVGLPLISANTRLLR